MYTEAPGLDLGACNQDAKANVSKHDAKMISMVQATSRYLIETFNKVQLSPFCSMFAAQNAHVVASYVQSSSARAD